MACYTFELSPSDASITNALPILYFFNGQWNSNIFNLLGLTDACNFDGNPSILTNNTYCIYTVDDCDTCSDVNVVNNDIDGDGVCALMILGCLDETGEPLATNYGYCDFSCYGCLDVLAS